MARGAGERHMVAVQGGESESPSPERAARPEPVPECGAPQPLDARKGSHMRGSARLFMRAPRRRTITSALLARGPARPISFSALSLFLAIILAGIVISEPPKSIVYA